MDTYKILGQLNVTTGATYEALYTCPVRAEVTFESATISVQPSVADRNTLTTVSSIIVCNTAGADTFSIRLLPTAATTPAAEHSLFVTTAIAANETKILSLGLTLSADNTIEVTCATNARVSFTAMGIETT